MEPKSFAEQFKGAMDNSTGAGSAPQKGQLVAKSVMECLMENTGSAKAANELLVRSILPMAKQIGTTDIAALRLVTLADRVAHQANAECRFLDFMNARNGSVNLTDYQYRIIESAIGTQTTDLINLDSLTLPAVLQSNYTQRYNTATATGNTIRITMMAQNIAGMQGNAGESNLFERQLDDMIIRINRKKNQTLLSNTEVVSEAAGQVPQLGGFITRSTNAPISASNGNFTNALLQQGLDQIAALYGSMEQCALFVTKGQLAVIRDLMINRFPGETSATHLEYMRQLYGEVKADAKGLQTSVIYQPYPGVALPVYYDQDLPSGQAILFKSEFPQLASMKWNGQSGPVMMARPEVSLADVAIVFDLFSLSDPLVNSRVAYTALAS